jgi:diguanylate cyclase (GGDEF)-like protein/PAS domain S-box-containing protein
MRMQGEQDQQTELALSRAYFEALDALLGTLNASLGVQESHEEWLRIMATVSRQSAVAIYLDDAERNIAFLQSSWVMPEIRRLEELQPMLRALPYDKFPALADTLAIGMLFHKSVEEMHPASQIVFLPLGIRHVLCIPLLDRDTPFGFIAFFDFNYSQSPSSLEMRLMATLVNHFAQVLLKQKIEAEQIANQQRLKALVGASQDMVFEFEPAGRIVHLWSELPFFPGGQDLQGQSYQNVLPHDLVQGIERALPRVIHRAGRFAQFNCAIPDGNGGSAYLLVRLQSVETPGRQLSVVAMVQDVSEMMQDAARRKTLLDTLNLLEEAVLDLSSDGVMVDATQGWARLRGIDSANMGSERGRPLADWVHPEDRAALAKVLDRLRESQEQQTLRFRLENTSGDHLWVEARLIAHHAPDGRFAGTRGVLRDVTVAHLNEQHITQLALYDNLTKLPNRLLLDNQLFQALERARRDNTRVALGFIDLDHFKQVNDAFGHKVGDELLVNVTRQLSDALGDKDVLARWGGDEFIALIPDLDDISGLRDYAEALRQAAQHGVMIEGLEARPTISVGFAVFPDDASTAEELLSAADHTMYRAKNGGRNNVCFYGDLVHSKTSGREQMVIRTLLDNAIREERVEVFYQPIVNARTREVFAVEALARWQDDQGNWVSPELFIPMAEKAGLIQSLSEQVIAHSFAQLEVWRKAGLSQRLMLNISRNQLFQPTLITNLVNALNQHGLTPQDVILEITESVAITDYSRQMKHLRQLAQTGFELAIDDFGTGYSSLSQLHEVPARFLKVDLSFTQRLHTMEGRSVMQAIVQLGQRLGLQVIVEGIEDLATERTLLDLGVQLVQGFFYCEPVQPGVVEVWMRLGMRAGK